MHVTGKFSGAALSLEGKLTVTFEINEKKKAVEELEKIQNVPLLSIDAKKYREKRSLTANGYFWVLCDQMAKVLGVDKWDMYLIQLSKYGVFTDVDVLREALPTLKKHFRYVQEFDDGYETGDRVTARCYYGSSGYDTKEMSDLINGTVQDAHDLGLETLTDAELMALIGEIPHDTKRND